MWAILDELFCWFLCCLTVTVYHVAWASQKVMALNVTSCLNFVTWHNLKAVWEITIRRTTSLNIEYKWSNTYTNPCFFEHLENLLRRKISRIVTLSRYKLINFDSRIWQKLGSFLPTSQPTGTTAHSTIIWSWHKCQFVVMCKWEFNPFTLWCFYQIVFQNGFNSFLIAFISNNNLFNDWFLWHVPTKHTDWWE